MNGSCVLQDIDDREVFTPEYWHIKLDEARDYTLLILHLLVIFTGMPLNVLVITKILTEQLYPQPTYLLLAVCDLLVCLIPVLINIIEKRTVLGIVITPDHRPDVRCANLVVLESMALHCGL